MSRAQRRRAASKALKTGRSSDALKGLTEELRDLLEEGNRLHQGGDLAGAARAYEKVLDSEPQQPQALYLLGSIAGAQGDPERAVELIERAIAANPKLAQAHNNLAIALLGLGRRDEAEAACRRAIKHRPRFGDAHRNLGDTLFAAGRFDEAEVEFRRAIDIGLDTAPVYNRLAAALAALGRPAEAVESIREAIRLEPSAPHHRQRLQTYLTQLVPARHFTMANDTGRNDAYQQALESAVTPTSRILELGTGSGLLAMMAARAGAKHVTTIEPVPIIAERARETIEANGLADRITVVAKNPLELQLGDDLPEACDLLLCGSFSDDFLGDEFFSSVAYARNELLRPAARIMPRAGAVMGALVDAMELARHGSVGTVAGFDLSGFNEFSPNRLVLPYEGPDPLLLSDEIELFRFDFSETVPATDSAVHELIVTADGVCAGVLQWIRIFFDGEASHDNAPGVAGVSHWRRSLYRFDASRPVSTGDVITFTAARSPTELAIVV